MGNIYQEHELEALLGAENLDNFDVDAIRDELTEVGEDGNRYWLDMDADEVNAVVAAHDLTAKSYGVFVYDGIAYYDEARGRYVADYDDPTSLDGDDVYEGASIDEAFAAADEAQHGRGWTCRRVEHEGAPPTWEYRIMHVVEFVGEGGEVADRRESLTDEARAEMREVEKEWR